MTNFCIQFKFFSGIQNYKPGIFEEFFGLPDTYFVYIRIISAALIKTVAKPNEILLSWRALKTEILKVVPNSKKPKTF